MSLFLFLFLFLFFWIPRGRQTICCQFQENWSKFSFYPNVWTKAVDLIHFQATFNHFYFLTPLWPHGVILKVPYLKMLNDASDSVASAVFSFRTCRRIRNSKKITSIRDFHISICINPAILSEANSFIWGGMFPADVDGFFDAPFKPPMFIINECWSVLIFSAPKMYPF